jgi:hypothetical protein
MNAGNCQTATVKENLTVQIWDIDGKSVVKASLTTDLSPLTDLDRLPLVTCQRRLQVRTDTLRSVLANLSHRSQRKTGGIQ